MRSSPVITVSLLVAISSAQQIYDIVSPLHDIIQSHDPSRFSPSVHDDLGPNFPVHLHQPLTKSNQLCFTRSDRCCRHCRPGFFNVSIHLWIRSLIEWLTLESLHWNSWNDGFDSWLLGTSSKQLEGMIYHSTGAIDYYSTITNRDWYRTLIRQTTGAC